MSRNVMDENTTPQKVQLPNFFQRSAVKWSLAAIGGLVTLAIIALVIWVIRLDHSIKTRFAEKRFAPPVEFYSAPEVIRAGSHFPDGFFEAFFKRKNYRNREFSEPIREGDVSFWRGDQCLTVVRAPPAPITPAPIAPSVASASAPTNPNYRPQAEPSFNGAAPVAPSMSADPQNGLGQLSIARCIAFKNLPRTGPQPQSNSQQDSSENSVNIIALAANGEIIGVYSGKSPVPVDSIEIDPELFAQYFGDNPTLRTVVPLGTAPTMCLNSLLAIEDSGFLEHSGVSFTGLLRAFLTNLRSGRAAQGGSTITQQLVKNYFLNDKKTLERKLTEIVMAFLVEQHATKDEILETYINLIYMGQNGPFVVRGFAAAANHYFGKDLSDLELDQCALLAAILNSPGIYNPFTHPEHATKRRNMVLDRMTELKMITASEAEHAKAAPLPSRPQRNLTEPAPYFVQAVRRFLQSQKIDEENGLRVFTTLNLRSQEAAHQAVRNGLERLEKSFPNLQKLKAQGKNLEAVLISSDPTTGAVQALVGGRGFLATQFNRAIDGRRQVGSVMKPFVYLTALESRKEDGTPYNAMTMLKDEPTTHHFEGQTWTPHNYEGEYLGQVPFFYALKESLNAATVNLGMAVGLDNIVETAGRMGITSKIKPLPSLTLGAFELSPMEVLEAYGTIAKLGSRSHLTLVSQVEDLNGKLLYQPPGKPEQVVSPEAVAQLIGVMKQTIQSGTGRGVKLSGFTHPAAGKTGTTNDKKDAWFAGYTPYHTAIVWVGYDDNTSHNLTGASGAVPIWTSYMKAYGASFPAKDFAWPAGVEPGLLTTEEQIKLGIPGKKGEPPAPTELVFLKGQLPVGIEPIHN